MVRGINFFVIVLAVLLVGCDRFYGLVIMNGYDKEISYSVIYGNGLTVNMEGLRPCAYIHIGLPDV